MPKSQSFKKVSKRKRRTKEIAIKKHRTWRKIATELKKKNLYLWVRMMQLIEKIARINTSRASSHPLKPKQKKKIKTSQNPCLMTAIILFKLRRIAMNLASTDRVRNQASSLVILASKGEIKRAIGLALVVQSLFTDQVTTIAPCHPSKEQDGLLAKKLTIQIPVSFSCHRRASKSSTECYN